VGTNIDISNINIELMANESQISKKILLDPNIWSMVDKIEKAETIDEIRKTYRDARGVFEFEERALYKWLEKAKTVEELLKVYNLASDNKHFRLMANVLFKLISLSSKIVE
jgi:hypothetical protein